MQFLEEKQRYMDALYSEPYVDKSKKGTVDEAVKPLLKKINSFPHYFTTSSCAGRISLFLAPQSGKKYEAKWLLCTHDELTKEELERHMDVIKEQQGEVYFHQEACILHVCCDSIESAQTLVDTARLCGFKRSGIMCTRKRIVVELLNTERVDTIIAKEGRLLVTADYLEELRLLANKKLRRTREKMQAFLEALEK